MDRTTSSSAIISAKEGSLDAARKGLLKIISPTDKHAQLTLLSLGLLLIGAGLLGYVIAQSIGDIIRSGSITTNRRLDHAKWSFYYFIYFITGRYGILAMEGFGSAAILSTALRHYKTALVCALLAIIAFALLYFMEF